MKDDSRNLPEMTAATIGTDLLEALVLELKMLPDIWPKLSQVKQNDVIDRVRKRVIANVNKAVHMLAAEGRVTIAAELEQVTVKDGIKAVLTMKKSDPNRHGLIDAQGMTVLVAIANPDDHMGDIAAVRGEPDQRAMDLGHEYDPNSDGKGMDDAAGHDVVDADFREIEYHPHESDLKAAYEAGRAAAANGVPKDVAPIAHHRLVAQWTQGWMDWHTENDGEAEGSGNANGNPELE